MDITFLELRARFDDLFTKVNHVRIKSRNTHRGHSAEHDALVAMIATRIAPDPRTAEKAFVAGILHSLDRVAGDEFESILDECLTQLVPNQFTPSESDEIRDAVVRHGEHKDAAGVRSLTLITLMDADKLANMQLLAIARAGQFYPDVPVIETEFVSMRNPNSTYHSPTSIIENLWGFVEWGEPGWLQLPEAKRMGVVLAARMREFILLAEAPYKEFGIAGHVI